MVNISQLIPKGKGKVRWSGAQPKMPKGADVPKLRSLFLRK